MYPTRRVCVVFDGCKRDRLPPADQKSWTTLSELWMSPAPSDRSTGERVTQTAFSHAGVSLLDWNGGWAGAGLRMVVQNAYLILAKNWGEGTEIFLFGKGTGAYAARMVAALIDEVGILGDNAPIQLAPIFLALDRRAKHPNDPAVVRAADATLAPFRARKEDQVGRAPDGFLVKCVGVFDTADRIRLPRWVRRWLPDERATLGFANDHLAECVQHGFQALALNRKVSDPEPMLWTQSDEARRLGQTIKQVWFAGTPTDLGGGGEEHDLADIALAWMISETMGMLKYDETYVESILGCSHPWGKQPPHHPTTRFWPFASSHLAKAATTLNLNTNEYIHSSVLEQNRTPALAAFLGKLDPSMVAPLLPYEEKLKALWPQIMSAGPTPPDVPLTQLGNVGGGRLTAAESMRALGRLGLRQARAMVGNVVGWAKGRLWGVLARVNGAYGELKEG